jgi:hypothetical protein
VEQDLQLGGGAWSSEARNLGDAGRVCLLGVEEASGLRSQEAVVERGRAEAEHWPGWGQRLAARQREALRGARTKDRWSGGVDCRESKRIEAGREMVRAGFSRA